MAAHGQTTSMRGVHFVAGELARHGFIASPTFRSTIGTDILVAKQSCSKAFPAQVKTNSKTFQSWLLGKTAANINSRNYMDVYVNIRDGERKRPIGNYRLEWLPLYFLKAYVNS